MIDGDQLRRIIDAQRGRRDEGSVASIREIRGGWRVRFAAPTRVGDGPVNVGGSDLLVSHEGEVGRCSFASTDEEASAGLAAGRGDRP